LASKALIAERQAAAEVLEQRQTDANTTAELPAEASNGTHEVVGPTTVAGPARVRDPMLDGDWMVCSSCSVDSQLTSTCANVPFPIQRTLTSQEAAELEKQKTDRLAAGHTQTRAHQAAAVC